MSDAAAVRTVAPLVSSADLGPVSGSGVSAFGISGSTGGVPVNGSGGRASLRRPRPWAAPLARPAARIALAGGLTLAGWLLGALVAGAGAEAAEQPPGADASGTTVATAPEHSGHGATAPGHSGHGAARDHRAEPHGHPWHGISTGSTADSDTTGTSAHNTTSDSPSASDGTGSAATTPSTSSASGSTHATSGGSTDTTDITDTPGATSQGGSDQVAPDPSGSAKKRGTDPSAPDQTTTETTADHSAADTSTETPQRSPEPPSLEPQSNGGLLGGLLGGVLGLVDTTLHSLTGVVGTVDDVGGSVLPPVTSVPTGTPPLIPIGDVLGPVFSGGTVSGGVTATVPEPSTQRVVTAVVLVTAPPQTPVTAPKTAVAEQRYPSVVHLVPVRRHATGVLQTKTENSHVGATGGGGGGGGGGLPAAPSAPVAPTTTANPGHDGSGGARQPFAVVGDSVTTTQLKLIGVSRDHEVAGAGRDAALPTTSPD
ncbi:hypothetical protein ACWEOE_09210 [Amycolatopsis sp. NPDC004368]